MKYFIKITLVLALVTVLFTACNDDDGYSLDRFVVSYGTIQGEGSNFNIICDDGTELNLVATLIPYYRPEDNKRVIANYTILDKKISLEKESYAIRLNNIYDVLTKKPVAQSAMNNDEELDQSIGNDPINIEDVWVGGKYLNVTFNIAVSGGSKKHFINLVHDDVSVNQDGYVDVTLRHNAYEESRNYMGFGFVSFDISGLVKEGEKSIEVRLKWTEYDGEEKTDIGTFTLRGGSAEPAEMLKVDKIATFVE